MKCTEIQSRNDGSLTLSRKERETLAKNGSIIILRPILEALKQPAPDAYFDKYNHGNQWNWWSPDGKQFTSQIIQCPFKVGDKTWIREVFSTSALGVYPMPKAWFKDDFFGRVTEPHDPTHFKGCRGNSADCFACDGERNGKFKWIGPSKMPKELSRFNAEVLKINVVHGPKSYWSIELKQAGRY